MHKIEVYSNVIQTNRSLKNNIKNKYSYKIKERQTSTFKFITYVSKISLQLQEVLTLEKHQMCDNDMCIMSTVYIHRYLY